MKFWSPKSQNCESIRPLFDTLIVNSAPCTWGQEKKMNFGSFLAFFYPNFISVEVVISPYSNIF